MSKPSLPLSNLRGVLIILIVAFHSFAAYIVSQPASPPAFDRPPYGWMAHPFIDSQRWIGFDLFCAFQFLYLMQSMFFLSGLFVWPSLGRKGWSAFFATRLWRLGVPFVLGAYLLMPLAFYPVYRVTAVDPSWSAFWSHWQALPITPTGPMWFLWFLLVLDGCAIALYQLPPRLRTALAGPASMIATAHPRRLFGALICVSAVAYLPLSAIYSPWKYVGLGPFTVDAALAPQYAIYFFFGLAVGAYGYNRGLLDANSVLVRQWKSWVAGSFASFLLWLVPMALIAKQPGAPLVTLRLIADLALVIFAMTTCFGMAAICLRFATTRWPIIDTISEHAFGIYFFHYAIVLWLQFALLGLALPAVAKGLLVLIAALTLSWAASAATTRVLESVRPLLERGAMFLRTRRADVGAELAVQERADPLDRTSSLR